MESLKIAHLFPDLLNLYGDGGNVLCLKRRCEWRDIPVEVVQVYHGHTIDLSDIDIVFLGGGPDREQRLAAEQLMRMKDDLGSYVEEGGVLLAICGGYQLLGHEWLLGNESLAGLGILNMTTKAPGTGGKRLISDIVLKSDLCDQPVVGYENHSGRTYLGEGLAPFGKVISSAGSGNNDNDKQDGACYKNVIGTYLHGPLLGKNPEIADHILQSASDRKYGSGAESIRLKPLDNTVENNANSYMLNRLGVH